MDTKEIESIFGHFEDIDYSLIDEDILDRDSSAYREAQVMNSLVREEISRKDDDPLTLALSEATHLADDVKSRYIELATIYLDDMQGNIFKNQFHLAQRYPQASADEWNDFLSDRIVSVYINKHKRTMLKASAEDNLSNPLSKNKRDSLKLIENLQAQESSENAKNIVIIRIPDIYDN